jgi:HAUS augmin-like complex subunit 1
VTKGLRGKLREAEGQLATLSQSQSQAQSRNGDGEIGTAGGLAAFEERERGLLELRGRVADLENRVQGFKGLPMEKEGARQEVRRVEGELEGLERRRDGLFEGLVGN